MSQSRPTEHEIMSYASEYILNGNNQVRAWRAAFKGSKAKAQTQVIRACEFHKRPEVHQRIDELKEEQRKIDAETFNMTAAEIKHRLHQVANLSINLKFDAQGNKVAHAPAAAVSALREINLMNGFHAPAKTELSNPDGSLRPTSIDPSKLSGPALEEILKVMDDTDQSE